MPEKILTMKLLEGQYVVCRLDKNALFPEWANSNDFFSITRTTDELSIVCPQENIPDEVKCEKDWRVFKIEGPLDFSLIGILAPISTILATAGVSIFAVSTFDTDYILVKNKDISCAVKALGDKGYEITI
ncbi:MAG: amino acid-binding protein [Firmicutes bacterium]|nr:amino acid-binding protein [Bacillota bacterium]